jgi:prepilin-type N-terminal cleavage/methylation domain-containing protein
MKWRERRGLTVLELLIVLVVMSIGAMVAASSVVRTPPPLPSRGERDSLALVLRRARTEAALTGHRVSLAVRMDGRVFYATAFPDGRVVTAQESDVPLTPGH